MYCESLIGRKYYCRELVADNVIIISSSCSDYVIHCVYVSRLL